MKKAQIEKVSAIILALVVLILIFMLLSNVRKEVESKSRLSICRATVEANSQDWFQKRPDVRCPTESVKLDLADETEIKNLIADKMKEGFDIFKPPEGATEWSLFGQDGIFCYVNTVVEFEDRKQPVTGLLKHLFDKKISKTDVSYMQYFQLKSKYADDVLDTLPKDKLADDAIDPSKRYAVVIVYARGKDKFKEFIARSNQVRDQIRAGGGFAFAGKIVFSGLTMGADLETVASTAAGVGGFLFEDNPYYQYFFGDGAPVEYSLMVFFKEYKKDSFEELGCEALPVLQKQ